MVSEDGVQPGVSDEELENREDPNESNEDGFDYETEYHKAVDRLAFVESILEAHEIDVDVDESLTTATYKKNEDGSFTPIYHKPAETQEQKQPAPKRRQPRNLGNGQSPGGAVDMGSDKFNNLPFDERMKVRRKAIADGKVQFSFNES